MNSQNNKQYFQFIDQYFPNILLKGQSNGMANQGFQVPQNQFNLMRFPPQYQYQPIPPPPPFFNPPNFNGNSQNPIYVGSDSDSDNDDDVQILPNPPKNRPPTPLSPLPKTTIRLDTFSVKIPIFSEEFSDAFFKALEMRPNIQIPRVSSFLNKAVRMKDKVDNLVKRIIIAGNDTYTSPSENYRTDIEKIVSNMYPDLYSQDYKKLIFDNRNNFLEILKDISQKYPILRKMRNPRIRKPTIEIDDISVAIYLIKISREQQTKRDALAKQQRYETAVLNHDLIECECCCCEYLFEDMAQCPDGHLFCKECLNREVHTLIGEGRSEVRCLSHSGCEKVVSVSELQRCVDEKTIKQLFIIEGQNAVAMANLPGLVKCHKCGFEATIDDSATFQCPVCHAETCPGCGEAAHIGISCEEMKKVDKDRFVEEKMNEAVIRVCPKCKTQFMKEEGCNKMECPRCHTWICYWCKKEIPKEVGYNHFWRQMGDCPPDKCPLWVQSNNNLQQIEASDAKEEGKEDLNVD